MADQDWDSVTRIGSAVRGGANAPKERVIKGSAINAAKRAGHAISTEKKYAGGSNKGQDPAGQHLTKVDRMDDVGEIKKVDANVGKAMQTARQAFEPPMTQKDLATKVNEKPSVINDYESGRAIPSQQVLAKLERVLKVKLRGKDIGSPLAPKGKGGSK